MHSLLHKSTGMRWARKDRNHRTLLHLTGNVWNPALAPKAEISRERAAFLPPEPGNPFVSTLERSRKSLVELAL